MSLEAHLKSFFQDKGVSYKEFRKSFVSECINPSCRKEDHLWIRKSNGRSICFKCGSKWSWQRLVAQIAKCSITNAYSNLFGEGAGDIIDQALDLDLFSPREKTIENKVDRPIVLGPDFVWAEKSEEAFQYVLSRGVCDPALFSHYDLRYHAGMHAVVFPIKRNSQIYGWQARRINPKEDELRLISSTNFNKSNFLLNYDRAKTMESLFLVEGPFDCLKVEGFGCGAVASFGKELSLAQIELLVSSDAKTIYIGLDPDASEEVYEVANKLNTNKNIYRVMPPSHRKDFGESTSDEIKVSLKEAHRLVGSGSYLEVYLK